MTGVTWVDIVVGVCAIALLLAFFSYSDTTGYKDHPPEKPDNRNDGDDLER